MTTGQDEISGEAGKQRQDLTSAPVLVIVGPTAVGKTALSLMLAQEFNGEIISADSRQIYRGLDIGTDKPGPEQQSMAPHHLLDVVDPDQILTLAEFQERAYAAIEAIHRRRRLPLLVGGTGQWIWAVVEGWGIPRVPPDAALRAELEAQSEAMGAAAFHARLAEFDPEAAAKIDARNVRRVIRAMEVYYKSGVPISQHQQKSPPPYQSLAIGLTRPRPALYRRIDRRIDEMMARGLLDEVKELNTAGYGWDQPAMSGLGYRQIGQFLCDEVSLEQAVALIKKETRRFVRQQYNWFRLDDARLHWFEIDGEVGDIYPAVRQLVNGFWSA